MKIHAHFPDAVPNAHDSLRNYMHQTYPDAMDVNSKTYEHIYKLGIEANLLVFELLKIMWNDQKAINEHSIKMKRKIKKPYHDHTNGAVRAVLDYMGKHYPGAMRRATASQNYTSTCTIIHAMTKKIEAYDLMASTVQTAITKVKEQTNDTKTN